MVSVNLFSLLCTGDTPVPSRALGKMELYGGPITYLILWSLILFGILVWVDSGSILPRRRPTSLETEGEAKREVPADVVEEARLVANSSDALRVLEVTKSFGGDAVVDDVSFGVSKDTIFALLGPNGAGKTTTFNIIRKYSISTLTRIISPISDRWRRYPSFRRRLYQWNISDPSSRNGSRCSRCLPTVHSNRRTADRAGTSNSIRPPQRSACGWRVGSQRRRDIASHSP
jgi:hypothetical protein